MYSRYLHKTKITLYMILSAMELARFHLYSTSILKLVYLTMLFILRAMQNVSSDRQLKESSQKANIAYNGARDEI